MAHIHNLYDFTITAYIVYKKKVLLVDHKELKLWLPIGGHIELTEDPDEALIREIKEESGLDVVIIAEIPKVTQPETKFLFRPEGIAVHKINKTHKHIDLIYFCKANSEIVTLSDGEHNSIRWFTIKDLNNPKFKIRPSVKFYAKNALKKVN